MALPCNNKSILNTKHKTVAMGNYSVPRLPASLAVYDFNQNDLIITHQCKVL
ncbi:hypothetical protein PGDDIFCJ_00089 [Thermus phage YS40_Isch]|nr:hypothetical protein PGDDIFCJ_00089 [Thermus phage YS40_Isch]